MLHSNNCNKWRTKYCFMGAILTLASALVVLGCVADGATISDEEGALLSSEIVQPSKQEAAMATATVMDMSDPEARARLLEEKQRLVESSRLKEDTPADTEAIAACSLCFTCGGWWPTYSGTIPVRGNPIERGASCSGELESTEDSIPYLCCN